MHIEESYGQAKTVTTNAAIATTRGLYIGGAGNVSVVMSDGTTAVFNSVPAGTTLKIAVQQVNSASTATNILALY